MKPIAKLTKRERAAILKDPNALLSDLLEIAALDAIALQKAKRVKFDMWETVRPPERRGGKCTVCLAGAALYRDLDVRGEGPDWTERPALCTNFMRIDQVRSGTPLHTETNALIQKHWSRNLQRAPFRVYVQVARELRKAGL